LVFGGREDVNAWVAIRRIDAAVYRLALKEQNAVYARFRHWLSGRPVRREWHHGWDTDRDFSMLYVFRWDHPAGQHQRLYGFLATPRPNLTVCVLCCHDCNKDEHATDKQIKRTVRALSEHEEVKNALKHAYGREREASWN
jgi:hypothetical protein